VSHHCTHLSYSETGYFSKLVTDYIGANAALKEFYNYTPDLKGIEKAIKERAKFPVNRKLLADVLRKQYAALDMHKNVAQNLDLLELENSFTVCTAHQPNLLTGYLYFIYKIVHAIKLASELKKAFPHNNFIPVYYMGSEDNDLDELGVFRYGDKKFRWDAAGQTGAVGRMNTESLKPLLDELFKLLGPPGENCEELKTIITKAYLEHHTISAATQYLVNELFGRYGLVVLDPDEAAFKQAFIPVMQDDLLNQTAYSIVSAQIEKLETNYKAQAQPRSINLFYLKDNLRERIEKKGEKWIVVNSTISFTKDELLNELNEYPERFSPNVILRGLFQETILPDVAFIGGGAEVAYWLQLKTLFENYKVFYPAILLRQSILWIEPGNAKRQEQLGLSVQDIFKNEAELVRQYIAKNSSDEWQTDEEAKAIEQILNELKRKATSLDPTLRASAEAALAKIKYQLQVLEKKMLRSEKKKMQEQLLKITRLKNALFPNNSLQERVENFSEYFIQYGQRYLDILHDSMEPLRSEFLIINCRD
jgi:bacillithiol biosynthesis cysteine-adding enzyme BshC